MEWSFNFKCISFYSDYVLWVNRCFCDSCFTCLYTRWTFEEVLRTILDQKNHRKSKAIGLLDESMWLFQLQGTVTELTMEQVVRTLICGIGGKEGERSREEGRERTPFSHKTVRNFTSLGTEKSSRERINHMHSILHCFSFKARLPGYWFESTICVLCDLIGSQPWMATTLCSATFCWSYAKPFLIECVALSLTAVMGISEYNTRSRSRYLVVTVQPSRSSRVAEHTARIPKRGEL